MTGSSRVMTGRVVMTGSSRVMTVRVAMIGSSRVTTGRDENLDGITSDRPEGVGRNQGEDSPLGPINELRREAGLEPVDELTTEPFLQVDLRLSQPFPLGDGGAGGEWYLQVFNLFDRYNPAMIDGRVTSVNFGEALGLAGPPRTLELGLRFGF